MRFLVTADTDIGISRKENQDSLLVKHASADGSDILLAVLCDGMGGLSRGELASAAVVRAFAAWFDQNIQEMTDMADLKKISVEWSVLLNQLNAKLLKYGRKQGYSGMGTTFSGMLLVGREYLMVHVGDTRIYQLDSKLVQKTTDQTLTASRVRQGLLTEEQAKTDPQRNVLLQCIGASRFVEPQILLGKLKKSSYLICSDGFWHELEAEEIYEAFRPELLTEKAAMHDKILRLMECVKARGETDNISAILIKVQ